MKKWKHVFWETLLIIASVFVFRSLWLLMDSVSFLSNIKSYVLLFALGIFFMGLSYYRLTHVH